MLGRWFKRVFSQQKQQSQKIEKSKKQPEVHSINPSLAHTLLLLKDQFGQSPDFTVRTLSGQPADPSGMAVCYFEGLIDQKLLTSLFEGLIREDSDHTQSKTNPNQIASRLLEKLPSGNIQIIRTEDQLFTEVLSGSAVIIMNNCPFSLAVMISGGARRSVEEPSSQTVVRGPKEGFTEDITTNIALVRRKIRSPKLKFETHDIGQLTHTTVVLAYIQDVANPDVVEEITQRLKSIDTDSILESGYIEEFIQDAPLSPFPMIIDTERPDTVAGSLLDGQVAVLVDGTPFALIAPVTFFNFFQTPEDYYQRYDISTFLRCLRLVAFLVSLLLPSLYIALTTFQQEMIPTTLLISLTAQREGTPFPALVETLLMEVTFEVIREAGIRMPRVVGPAISIVGALVIGQAAVEAGLVSAAIVIVVSFTAISNFVIPYFSMSSAIRLLRFVLMFLAGFLGLFGILAGLIPLLAHLLSLKSFGIDYLMPYSPFFKSNMKDLVIRAPWWAMKTRPNVKSSKNRIRQAPHQYPKGTSNRLDNMKESEQ
ncbi:spore germination protein [Paenibacillus tianjinensis]|uniref:Spore germination protein n=1 Tax=Paenibacillus tianjinensis TaxID=2810347 RepID=A0ABX7LF80_9BACL|nr:spore germination protein [Paenibacillus tianjinensis]QSF46626.1 spore germination protein [Paenibacillus tianjinensis]